MRTLEDEEGPGLGVHVEGHVGEVDCSVACDLLGLSPGADDRLGGFVGPGRDVVGLDAEVQAAAAGLSLIRPCVFPFEDASYKLLTVVLQGYFPISPGPFLAVSYHLIHDNGFCRLRLCYQTPKNSCTRIF